MVNGNDLVKHNYLPYIYIYILNLDVYIFTTDWYKGLYIAHIFLNERILQIFLKMCVFILG